MRRSIKKPGFTLIELLLYASIISVILLAISAYMGLLFESRIKNQSIAEVEQQALQVSQQISQSVRNAKALNSPAIGTTASSLSLATDDVAKDPTVFDLAGGVIRMKEGTSPTVNLTSSLVTVGNLTFRNLSAASTPGVIRFEYTVARVNGVGRNEYSYSQTYYGSATLRR